MIARPAVEAACPEGSALHGVQSGLYDTLMHGYLRGYTGDEVRFHLRLRLRVTFHLCVLDDDAAWWWCVRVFVAALRSGDTTPSAARRRAHRDATCHHCHGGLRRVMVMMAMKM